MIKQKEQEAFMVNELIFNTLNDDVNKYYDFLDVHGQFQNFVAKIVPQRLLEIKIELREGRLKPNFDEHNHVFKISAGAARGKAGTLKKMM